MRREGEAVDAAGRAREDRRGAPHPEADAERPERRAHRLRLIVRAFGIIGIVAGEHVGLAGEFGGFAQ
ncbi:hypothetical protein ABG067_009635, partial [Albugo candida]